MSRDIHAISFHGNMSRDTTRSGSFPSKNYYTLSLILFPQIIKVHIQFVMTDNFSGNDRRRSTMEWDRINCIHTTKAAQVKSDANVTAIKRIIKTHECAWRSWILACWYNYENNQQDALFFCGAATQRGVMASSFLRFLDHTQRRTTVGRTPLGEWSARRRDL